jgi:hypothetical protein
MLKGGKPGCKVSWQITGIRHDTSILKHPIITVVDKGPGQLVGKGQYIFLDYEKYAATSNSTH